MNPEHLLDYGEAAALLGVKRGTLQSLVCRGQIPHVRLSGRLVRFQREALVVWLRARTFVVPEKPAT